MVPYIPTELLVTAAQIVLAICAAVVGSLTWLLLPRG
jgi:hypothetical protein